MIMRCSTTFFDVLGVVWRRSERVGTMLLAPTAVLPRVHEPWLTLPRKT